MSISWIVFESSWDGERRASIMRISWIVLETLSPIALALEPTAGVAFP